MRGDQSHDNPVNFTGSKYQILRFQVEGWRTYLQNMLSLWFAIHLLTNGSDRLTTRILYQSKLPRASSMDMIQVPLLFLLSCVLVVAVTFPEALAAR